LKADFIASLPMQPSGSPCYSSERYSERRSIDTPLGGRRGDASTFIASEKRVPARPCTASGNGEEISLDLILFERFLRAVALHCGIRHCFADPCLREAYLPRCGLLDAIAMPSPLDALFVCASACLARSRHVGLFHRACLRRLGSALSHA
jgi:hypothetical protein